MSYWEADLIDILEKMKSKCSSCQYGGYNPLSDICDECMEDPDTGWGGFTDHRVGKHFNSREEQTEYYRTHDIDDEYDEDYEDYE